MNKNANPPVNNTEQTVFLKMADFHLQIKNILYIFHLWLETSDFPNLQAGSVFHEKLPYNFYQNVKLSTSAFLYSLCYINFMEGWQMNHKSFEKQIIRKQDLYTQQLSWRNSWLYISKKTRPRNEKDYEVPLIIINYQLIPN